uniref:Oxysterol-binding protein n=1 Tax=Timema monikensis TaxID=170555 RepID=A0A7R9E063_9NEOP|nr:unnamed protein product [Timema monikensis]
MVGNSWSPSEFESQSDVLGAVWDLSLTDGVSWWPSSIQKSRIEEVIVTRLRVGHTSLTHGFLLRVSTPSCVPHFGGVLQVLMTCMCRRVSKHAGSDKLPTTYRVSMPVLDLGPTRTVMRREGEAWAWARPLTSQHKRCHINIAGIVYEIGLRPFADTNSEQCNELPATDATAIPAGRPLGPPVCPDGSLDYDGEACISVGSLESHGSVISHLVSQVKIGMDLTKVVLPTFILERRSLLEMYADYFAHPDMFVSIADFSDPKDRMVQVVRWYVSAYHAGRKSPVAKKPYNPILGEVFQCHWDIPGCSETGSDPLDLVTDGPVPWCNRNQLTFVAEQVSHHPPVSAFYGEHYNKRISFCAHVWTKSKFLGLSVGVYNIGQGCISVLDYDEEYIITFPNGYGRCLA